MALQSGDLFLVQRGDTPYKETFDNLKTELGSGNVSVGDNSPADAKEGDLWWNSDDDSGRLYVYYDDGNSQQWVEASPQGEGGGGTDVDLSNYVTLDTSQNITGKKTFNHSGTDSIILNRGAVNQYTGITFSEVDDPRYLLYVANTADGSLNLQCRKNGTNIKSALKINLDGTVQIPQLTDVIKTTGDQTKTGVMTFNSKVKFSGFNTITSSSNPQPSAGSKATYAWTGMDAGTVIGVGNGGKGALFGNTGTNWTNVISFINGAGSNCGHVECKKDIEPRFTLSSDRRLKRDIRDAEPMLEKFEQIKVRRYTVDHPDDEGVSENMLGFVADELQEVFPDAVNGEPNAMMTVGSIIGGDGEVLAQDVESPETGEYTLEEGQIFAAARTEVPKYQSVASSALIVPMTKAIQELIAINKDLTARIEQLESDHATLMNNNGGSY